MRYGFRSVGRDRIIAEIAYSSELSFYDGSNLLCIQGLLGRNGVTVNVDDLQPSPRANRKTFFAIGIATALVDTGRG